MGYIAVMFLLLVIMTNFSILVLIGIGSDRRVVLDYLQKHFAMEFCRFGTLKESDSLIRNYKVRQAWNRIRKHIKKYPPNKQ